MTGVNVGLMERNRERTAPAAGGWKARIEPRYAAIWVALAVLMLLNALLMPRAMGATAVTAVLPFAAFLALAAAGQAMVIMMRGIDLSVPATVTLSSAVLLGMSEPGGGGMWPAIGAAILAAALVGAVNGFLVAALRLNALIVTLATGSIVTGITIAYRESAVAEAMVPKALAEFSSGRTFGLPTNVVAVLLVILLLAFLLRKTVIGRRFELVGNSPEAALLIGLRVRWYQAGAYLVAALLYGGMAVLLAGFIRNPTLEVGAPYLLAPIAAAVLAGTAITGGSSSILSIAVAALFLTQLDQTIRMLGLPTAWQMIVQGMAIGAGMFLSDISERLVRR